MRLWVWRKAETYQIDTHYRSKEHTSPKERKEVGPLRLLEMAEASPGFTTSKAYIVTCRKVLEAYITEQDDTSFDQ
jgi:hypothetical protein